MLTTVNCDSPDISLLVEPPVAWLSDATRFFAFVSLPPCDCEAIIVHEYNVSMQVKLLTRDADTMKARTELAGHL